MDTREFSLTRLEDRYVNQAILYMQVTIVKVLWHCLCSNFSYFSGYIFVIILLLVISFNACPCAVQTAMESLQVWPSLLIGFVAYSLGFCKMECFFLFMLVWNIQLNLLWNFIVFIMVVKEVLSSYLEWLYTNYNIVTSTMWLCLSEVCCKLNHFPHIIACSISIQLNFLIPIILLVPIWYLRA